MSEPELKPCPFCGVGAVTFDTHDKDADMPFYAVACPQCHCMTTEYAQLEHAIEVWNTRIADRYTELMAIAESLADRLNVTKNHVSKVQNSLAEKALDDFHAFKNKEGK